MNVYRSILTLAALLLLAACASTPKVYSDFDPAQDFSQYTTFSWTSADPVIINSETPVSPLVVDRLKAAVKSIMEQKGYTFVDLRSTADIAITLTIGARDKIEIRQEPNVMYNNDWRWGNRYWVGASAPAYTDRTIEYEEGTLAIDIFDVNRHAPVWHGVSEKRLKKDQRAGEASFINTAVENTLMVFPSQGGNIASESDAQ